VGHVAHKAETDVKLIAERYETENLFEGKGKGKCKAIPVQAVLTVPEG